MANIKFSQLPNLGNITAATIVPVVAGNVNYTVTAANLQTFVNGGNGNITSGNISASGNITGGNIITAGYVSAGGNITGANVITIGLVQGSTLSVTGNINGSNLNITGNIVDSAGNLQINSTGNINLIPISTVNVTGSVSATGNITGAYIIGNGSQLTGLPPTYGNANVAAYLPTYSGNIGNLTVTGTTVLNPYVETTTTLANPSGSFTPQMSSGPVQRITLNGSITLNLAQGMSQGQSITLVIQQPSGGGATMTASGSYKFAYGVKTLSVTANTIDVLSIFYDGTNYLCNLVKGYV